MPSAPLASFSPSKRRLIHVDFILPETIRLEDKENINPNAGRAKGSFPVETDHDQSRLKAVALPPRTPSGKISILDLTANPEDALNQMVPLGTPNDHVTWTHVPGSGITPSSSVKTTQRGTKRARSSSPPSSSQLERSKHFRPNDDCLNMGALSQSLHKSPSRRSPNQDDPAAALWNLYANRKGHEPALPPLPFVDISPQAPGDDTKTTNFRRAVSCTNNWPSSSAKKRKLENKELYNSTKDLFAKRKPDILKPDTSKQSRVNVLLESVQQLLEQRKNETSGPSSSSPMPERFRDCENAPAHQPQASPSKLRRHSNTGLHDDSPEMEDGSSDYGDLDLDVYDIQVLEQKITQSSTSVVHESPSKIQTQRSLRIPVKKNPQVVQNVTPALSMNQQSASEAKPVAEKVSTITNNKVCQSSQGGFGEFSDESDDHLDDELQVLAAKVESQNTADRKCLDTLQSNHAPVPVPKCDGSYDDDNDNDDDLWDQIIDEVKNVDDTAARSSMNQRTSKHRAIKRYFVITVLEGSYELSPGQKRPQKELAIKDERTKQLYTIYLRQSWYDSRLMKGSYIHLIGDFDRMGQCFVDDMNNMIILHPDHLISATVIGDAITCLRRAALQDRVKATAPPEKPQVYGHMLHEIFGEALRLNEWELDAFQKIIHKIIPNYLESLYEIGVQEHEASEHLMSKVSLLKAWAGMFVSASIMPDAVMRDRKGALVPTAINKLLELEEHVWSPMYGLKGNIDATVEAQMHLPGDKFPKNLLVPLELKTGMRDSNESHRAQTALYTLLLSDRYDINITTGILYYLETSKTIRIEGVKNEIRQMIQWRNEIACYVHDKLDLPPMIRKEHLCKRCYAQTSCFTYHRLVENGNGDTSGMKEIFNDAVNHLQPIHQGFFKRWDELLTKEERDAMKFKRELWTMLSKEREQVGRCFANVKIEPSSAVENSHSPKINRYTYSFVKHNGPAGFSFTESQITIGEPIVVSDEKGHFALANGFVTNVRPSRITVAVDRKLQNSRKRSPDFDAEANQSFAGIMEVTSGTPPFIPDPTSNDEPTLYRIDKDEFSNGMATVRNNLIRVMEKELFQAKELRKLIIELQAPCFKPTSTAYKLCGPASQQNINVDQRAAIEKVMSAKDYALVLGMPGTGKTTTIAHIIRALVSQGKSILLTSYTHTAVDNILLKIKDDNIPILRLGSVGKVHPEVQNFADLSGIPKESMAELEKSWSKSKVVATTCLSINHGIFNHRIFDYCIVDEASQITLPVCLGPIRFASTFILVGDHYQLPPLVQNKEAQEGGLDVSLFKLLSDAQPNSVVSLEHQYRMAEDIMTLSNELIYSGRLKCGTTAIANRVLQVPDLNGALEAHHDLLRLKPDLDAIGASDSHCSGKTDCWIRKSLSPNSRVLLLNTDYISAPNKASEQVSGSRITNTTESALIAQLLTVLVRAGVPPRSIGVITFYRSQLALLKRDVKATAGSAAAQDIEMHTADKYQGRDKEVILLSCVRSNENQHVGELLRDWRRVNVAITRARSKLLIVGSRHTLGGSGVKVLEGMVQIMQSKNWIIDLPPAATQGHVFETAFTQTQYSLARTTGVHPASRPKSTSHSSRLPDSDNLRVPLSSTDANVANNKISQKAYKMPMKVVRGGVSVENLLDRRPIIRDIANEIVDLTVMDED